MMLYKNQIQVIFLFEFKMGRKAVETTSTTHMAQELLMNVQCSASSRSFTKETNLKMSSTVASHQKLTMTN